MIKDREARLLSQRRCYQKKRAQYIAKVKEDKHRKIEWFREYKSKLSCERCGQKHPACLEFHHRDPGKKESEVSLAVHNWSIERTISEIAKCSVLCSNCHKILHWEEKQNESQAPLVSTVACVASDHEDRVQISGGAL